MHTIPEIVPLAEMQARMVEMVQRLQRGPVVLTENDRATAVLVSPEAWNNLIAELEDLRDALDALHAYEVYQQHPEAVKPWSEIRTGLVAEGRLDIYA
jgi:PHD/YefM family antitoxin component YafN of YafNO toxin-antitoxin module